jgi:DNA-binding transcriptional MocR family regulator
MITAERGRTAEEARRILLGQISAGQLRPGQRLGAERALATELGVSRATLRQALAVLEETGWCAGCRAVAAAPSSARARSRGMKMRVSSGAGAEVLMAGAEGRSMLYLEARCVALARAIGAQGVQNGGIDGASVAASMAARG